MKKGETKEIVNIPENKVDLNFKKNVDTTLANREYFRSQIEETLKVGEDYYIIKEKKSLSKGGAEKLASMFKLVASFESDKETREQLGEIKGLVAFRCILKDEKGNFKGEGRGADTVARNQNDPNKAIKMAQKRAYLDAVIRTTGLSDIFTQDLEDMSKDTISEVKTFPRHEKRVVEESKQWIKNPNEPASDKQKEFIDNLLLDIEKDIPWLEKKTGFEFDKLTKGQASPIIKELERQKDKKFKEAEIEQPNNQ